MFRKVEENMSMLRKEMEDIQHICILLMKNSLDGINSRLGNGENKINLL